MTIRQLLSRVYITSVIVVGIVSTVTHVQATSELTGITESNGEHSDIGQRRNRARARARWAILKKYVSPKKPSSYTKDDIKQLSYDAYVLYLNNEGATLRRRWRALAWSPETKRAAALTLAERTQPPFEQSPDDISRAKMAEWRNFQARIIREATRPEVYTQ